MFKHLILAGCFLAAASACGGTDDNDPAESSPTRTAGPDYATQVNALCADLMSDVLPITADKPKPTPEEFLGFAVKIDPLIDQFDEKVDAIDVSAADKSAAEAFDAYRAKVDDADAEVRKVARTGDGAAFDAAFMAFLDDLSSSPEKAELTAAGIDCPAR